jgi:hypothetical protein
VKSFDCYTALERLTISLPRIFTVFPIQSIKKSVVSLLLLLLLLVSTMESDSDFPLDIELAEEFLELASEQIHGLVGSADLVDCRFRSYFGVSYRLCSHLW